MTKKLQAILKEEGLRGIWLYPSTTYLQEDRFQVLKVVITSGTKYCDIVQIGEKTRQLQFCEV